MSAAGDTLDELIDCRRLMRELVVAFDRWDETTYAIGGGRDNVQRFRAFKAAVERARALLERQS